LSDAARKERDVANHPSSWKRMRQNERRRARNRAFRSKVKTRVKRVLEAVNTANSELAHQALKDATSVLHKSASKGVHHRNTVARKVSRLARKVNSLSK
jgi:small subunit ribosomal protein S20